MRRILSLLLAAALLLSLTNVALAEEPIKLTIAIPDKVNVEDYNTNEMTLQLEEDLGIDIEFIVLASTDYATKINLMVQSGNELPDAIICQSMSLDMIYSWAQEGAIIPLTDYYADPELAVNINKSYEEVGDFRPMITLPDGEIYQVPTYAQSVGNEQGSKLWLDVTVLEEMGLSLPTTTDEMLEMFRAVKAKYPDKLLVAGYGGVRGDSSSSWFDYFMNSFVYSNSNKDFMKIDDGKLSFAYTTEEWKEGLKYIKTLIDEDIIARESLTQDRTQWISMINTLDTFGLVYITPGEFTDGRKDIFRSIDPMVGPEGVQYARYCPTQPSNGMIITADCEHPEEAFKLADLLVSRDYTITNRWGQRGRDWDYFEDYAATLDDYDESEWSPTIPGCERLIIVYDDPTFWGSGNMQNRAWMNSGPAIRGFGVAGGRTINANTIDLYTLHMAESYQQYPPFYPAEYIGSLIYSEEESAVIGEILTNLETYVALTTSNWLLGVGDIDAEWDDFQAELKKIGIDKAVEIAQIAYTRSVSN